MFRPLPVMTAFAAPSLALLITLGVWQVERAEEKARAIAAYEATASETAARDLETLLCASGSSPYGRRAEVGALADALSGETVRFAGVRGDTFGWRQLRLVPRPLCACAGVGPEGPGCDDPAAALVIEVGFEALDGRVLPANSLVSVAAPFRANRFTPPNAPQERTFRRFAPDELAAGLGAPEGAIDGRYWLIADDGALPPDLAQVPPARHYGYALTWFGLAAALVGVYFAFHHARGRLGRVRAAFQSR